MRTDWSFKRLPVAHHRDAVWRKSNGKCIYCGVVLGPPKSKCDNAFVIDHMHPVKRGGANELFNLMPACRKCNKSKGSLLMPEWRGKLRFGADALSMGQMANLRKLGIDYSAYWMELYKKPFFYEQTHEFSIEVIHA